MRDLETVVMVIHRVREGHAALKIKTDSMFT